MVKNMYSSFENITLSANEIADYIKKHGELKDASVPCVYIPDIKVSGYEYSENGSSNISLPFGINENDKKYLADSVFVLINDSSTNAISTSIKKYQ